MPKRQTDTLILSWHRHYFCNLKDTYHCYKHPEILKNINFFVNCSQIFKSLWFKLLFLCLLWFKILIKVVFIQCHLEVGTSKMLCDFSILCLSFLIFCPLFSSFKVYRMCGKSLHSCVYVMDAAPLAIKSLVILMLQETQLPMWDLLALHIMIFIPLKI